MTKNKINNDGEFHTKAKVIKNEMVNIFNINNLHYDFMGYSFCTSRELSFHHLIIPKRLNGPVSIENGSILVKNTAHDYLHIIESIDHEIFELITDEMIDENIKRKITMYKLKRIRMLLEYFEREHCADKNKNGANIIKESYIRKRIKL